MHFSEGVDTTCTSDEDLAIVFGVKVDETFALEHAVLKLHRACKSCLFVHGKETLDSRMLQFGISDSRKRHGDTDTIVATEGRSFGFEPFAVDIGFDRVIHEIMGHVAVLLANHIHVRLKDHSLVIFISWCSRHAHNDVHRLIGYTLDTMLRRPSLQPAANFLLMFGRTRHLTNLRKDLKYSFAFIHF